MSVYAEKTSYNYLSYLFVNNYCVSKDQYSLREDEFDKKKLSFIRFISGNNNRDFNLAHISGLKSSISNRDICAPSNLFKLKETLNSNVCLDEIAIP